MNKEETLFKSRLCTRKPFLLFLMEPVDTSSIASIVVVASYAPRGVWLLGLANLCEEQGWEQERLLMENLWLLVPLLDSADMS